MFAVKIRAMRLTIYTLLIYLYGFFLQIAAHFHPKAHKWVRGRKNWREELEKGRTPGRWIWFHCASLGEFEQGRNLIEALKRDHPGLKILLTFFSPSGYEVRKGYKQADLVAYLPLDTPRNAREFVHIVKPEMAFFIKYELWLHTLRTLAENRIPTFLVAARVRADSAFLTSFFAPLYRQAFRDYRAIFTQDEATMRLLQSFAGVEEVHTSGDTRYDRVAATRTGFQPIPGVEAFKGQRLCWVVGSSWPQEERMILPVFDRLCRDVDLCLIVAPHEIHPEAIAQWVGQNPGISLTFSQISSLEPQHRILWIDNIGLLSSLYHYADIAYVGGAWGSGLHNILEPTVFGCPVIFGPKYRGFQEAIDLIDAGGAFSVDSETALYQQMHKLLENPEHMAEIRRNNETFVQQREGATAFILEWLAAHLAWATGP